MNLRINKIYKKIEEEKLNGFIVSHPANISYLTGLKSRDSYLLVSEKQNAYFTDFRYIEESQKRIDNSVFKVNKTDGSVFSSIAKECLGLGLKKIGFESRYMPFAEYKKITDLIHRKAKLIPKYGLVEELRQIKDAKELKRIKKAVNITKLAFDFAKKILKPGKKELEIVAELERFIRYHGADGPAFETIVASGPNSSLPHHLSSERKLRSGEPVLIDLGVEYKGYKSDLTRVFFLGKINFLVQKVYNIVLEAQKKAIASIKPFINTQEIDAAARNHIRIKGFSELFGHNLGHGVGIETHEEPTLSRKDLFILEPGMVFTVEPGIYIPNKFGIRIEDMILVKNNGCEVLSGAVNK